METYYLIIIGILFLLAISDLIVGVSNDAVNFLNSAIGSKAAPFRTIMIFAAAGILFGAVFSSGMMEVARKGIFHPQHFYFAEIVMVFLAVMLTDIILLDMFNTFGMPTSTTVSIVFELLGAAVAMSVIKIYTSGSELAIGDYINTQKAMAIISGILLSVVIAITIGAILQYIIRLVFTFDYVKRLKFRGPIWGSISISGIIYFILIKGVKGATFMTDEVKELVIDNTWQIIGATAVIAWVIFYVLQALFKVDILKVIVLIGTFALAMAFASNDLVNFIGVPMAAFNSYKMWLASGTDPSLYAMGDLAKKVPTNSILLLLSGIIMVVTLWISRKARTVTETEVNLGRQSDGYERFGSNLFARLVVQSTMDINKAVTGVLPKYWVEALNKRFTLVKNHKEEDGDAPHFDMLRASVNIVVAAIVISIGTSLKLPLSTTYVTFMVAMGTSLADRAWGRESAVYRVSGVLTVIGGWFFTAFFAFTSAFIILTLLHFGGFVAVIALVLGAAYFVYQTHFLHKKRTEKKEKLLHEAFETGKITNGKIVEKSKWSISYFMNEFGEVIDQVFDALGKEDRKALRQLSTEFKDLNKMTKSKKDNVSKVIDHLTDEAIESGYHYVQVMDYLREMTHSTRHIVKPVVMHVENSHKPLLEIQHEELDMLSDDVRDFMLIASNMVTEEAPIDLDALSKQKDLVIKSIGKVKRKQIKRIKKNEVGTRNSILFLDVVSEMKNVVLFAYGMVKSHEGCVNLLQNGSGSPK